MDPLSITASIITLMVTASAIAKTLKDLRGASSKFQVIADELLDFQGLLRQASSIIEGNEVTIPEDQLHELSRLLNRAKEKFNELNTIIQNRLVRSREGGKTKVSKVAWAKYISQITALQVDMTSIKHSLGALLNSMSM
jgi:hypothetical protein